MDGAALRPLASRDGCMVVPRRATICAVGVSFAELHRAHGDLGTTPCGLDHAPLDDVWRGCRGRPMAYHLWQYQHTVVSTRPVQLIAIDYAAALGATATHADANGAVDGYALTESTATHEALGAARRWRVRMALREDAPAIDAVALSVSYGLSGGADGGGADGGGGPYTSSGHYCSPDAYSPHEVVFLPSRRPGDAPLSIDVVLEAGDGALRLEFPTG